jgi:anti-sigma B factor antagonist
MQPIVEHVQGVTIVTILNQELDASNADELKSEMAPVLQNSNKLVLDLSNVQFVDSRGCGVILSLLKNVSSAGGDLKLCNVNRPVRTIFDLIRLHRICEIHETKEAAVQAFQVKQSS